MAAASRLLTPDRRLAPFLSQPVIVMALAFLIASTVNSNADLSKIAGWLTFAFAAVGAYIYLGLSSATTGGPALPLGRAVLK